MSAETEAPIVISAVKNEGELMQALALREIVFIEEQSVPESMERDDDDATAYHVLALAGGHAIGTGRLVMLPSAPDGETGKPASARFTHGYHRPRTQSWSSWPNGWRPHRPTCLSARSAS